MDSSIIDKSFKSPWQLGSMHFYSIFTGIHGMSRAAFLTAFREVGDLPQVTLVSRQVYTAGCPTQESPILILIAYVQIRLGKYCLLPGPCGFDSDLISVAWESMVIKRLCIYNGSWKTQTSLATEVLVKEELSQPAGDPASPDRVTHRLPAGTLQWTGHGGAHCAQRPSSGWSLLIAPGQRYLQRVIQQLGSPR